MGQEVPVMNALHRAQVRVQTFNTPQGRLVKAPYIPIDGSSGLLLRPCAELLPNYRGKEVDMPEWHYPGSVIAECSQAHSGHMLVVGGPYDRHRQLVHTTEGVTIEAHDLKSMIERARGLASRLLKKGVCLQEEHDALIEDLLVIENSISMDVVDERKVRGAALLTQVTADPRPESKANAQHAMTVYASVKHLTDRLNAVMSMRYYLNPKIRRVYSAIIQMESDIKQAVKAYGMCLRATDRRHRRANLYKLGDAASRLEVILPYGCHATAVLALIKPTLGAWRNNAQFTEEQRRCIEFHLAVMKLIRRLEQTVLLPLTLTEAKKSCSKEHRESRRAWVSARVVDICADLETHRELLIRDYSQIDVWRSNLYRSRLRDRRGEISLRELVKMFIRYLAYPR